MAGQIRSFFRKTCIALIGGLFSLSLWAEEASFHNLNITELTTKILSGEQVQFPFVYEGGEEDEVVEVSVLNKSPIETRIEGNTLRMGIYKATVNRVEGWLTIGNGEILLGHSHRFIDNHRTFYRINKRGVFKTVREDQASISPQVVSNPFSIFNVESYLNIFRSSDDYRKVVDLMHWHMAPLSHDLKKPIVIDFHRMPRTTEQKTSVDNFVQAAKALAARQGKTPHETLYMLSESATEHDVEDFAVMLDHRFRLIANTRRQNSLIGLQYCKQLEGFQKFLCFLIEM